MTDQTSTATQLNVLELNDISNLYSKLLDIVDEFPLVDQYPIEHEVIYKSDEADVLVDSLKHLNREGIAATHKPIWENDELATLVEVTLVSSNQLIAYLAAELVLIQRRIHVRNQNLSNFMVVDNPVTTAEAALTAVIESSFAEERYVDLFKRIAIEQF